MEYLKREEGIFGEQMARTFGGNRFLLRARTGSLPPPSPRSAPYNGSLHRLLGWQHAPRLVDERDAGSGVVAGRKGASCKITVHVDGSRQPVVCALNLHYKNNI